MKNALGVMGILAIALTGCSGAPLAPESEATEKILFHGGIQVHEQVRQHEDGSCTTTLLFLSTYLDALAGSQVVIKDASGEVVATPTVEVSHVGDSCTWIFEQEIEKNSDFYQAEFLDMETEIMPVSEAEDGVITFDIQTPIADRIEGEASESWNISPLDSFPGN